MVTASLGSLFWEQPDGGCESTWPGIWDQQSFQHVPFLPASPAFSQTSLKRRVWVRTYVSVSKLMPEWDAGLGDVLAVVTLVPKNAYWAEDKGSLLGIQNVLLSVLISRILLQCLNTLFLSFSLFFFFLFFSHERTCQSCIHWGFSVAMEMKRLNIYWGQSHCDSSNNFAQQMKLKTKDNEPKYILW